MDIIIYILAGIGIIGILLFIGMLTFPEKDLKEIVEIINKANEKIIKEKRDKWI